MMFDPILMLITLVFMGIGMFVSSRLKSKFTEYSQTPVSSGISGKEVAEKMLRDHGITDVKITSVDGQLTDHYNPLTKTVNLSREVYEGRNVAAAAVSAHECGHAVQHAHAYSWLSLRSAIVPVVNISSKAMNIIILAGFLLGFMYQLLHYWTFSIKLDTNFLKYNYLYSYDFRKLSVLCVYFSANSAVNVFFTAEVTECRR